MKVFSSELKTARPCGAGFLSFISADPRRTRSLRCLSDSKGILDFLRDLNQACLTTLETEVADVSRSLAICRRGFVRAARTHLRMAGGCRARATFPWLLCTALMAAAAFLAFFSLAFPSTLTLGT